MSIATQIMCVCVCVRARVSKRERVYVYVCVCVVVFNCVRKHNALVCRSFFWIQVIFWYVGFCAVLMCVCVYSPLYHCMPAATRVVCVRVCVCKWVRACASVCVWESVCMYANLWVIWFMCVRKHSVLVCRRFYIHMAYWIHMHNHGWGEHARQRRDRAMECVEYNIIYIYMYIYIYSIYVYIYTEIHIHIHT